MTRRKRTKQAGGNQTNDSVQNNSLFRKKKTHFPSVLTNVKVCLSIVSDAGKVKIPGARGICPENCRPKFARETKRRFVWGRLRAPPPRTYLLTLPVADTAFSSSPLAPFLPYITGLNTKIFGGLSDHDKRRFCYQISGLSFSALFFSSSFGSTSNHSPKTKREHNANHGLEVNCAAISSASAGPSLARSAHSHVAKRANSIRFFLFRVVAA